MPNIAKVLYQDQPIAVAGQWSSVPIPNLSLIKLVINNRTSPSAQLTVAIVPPEETLAEKHEILTNYEVPGRIPIFEAMSIPVEPGSTLYMRQETAGAINVYVAGLEMT